MSSKFDDVLSKSLRPHPRVANSPAPASSSASETPSLSAVRLSLHDTALDHLAFDGSVQQAAASGWSQLSLMRRTLWRHGAGSLVRLLRQHELRVSTLGWTGGFTGLAGFTYREAIEDGRIAIAEAAALGAETVLVAPGARGTHTYRHSQRMVTDGLRALAEFAARHQIHLAVLATPSRRRFANWTSLNTLESIQQLFDTVNIPSLGLVLPLNHWQHIPTAPAVFAGMVHRIQIVISSPLCLRGQSLLPSTPSVCTNPINREGTRPVEWSEGTVCTVNTLQTLLESGFQGEWNIEPALNSTGSPCQTSAGELLHSSTEYHNLLSQLRLRGGEPIVRW